MRILLVILSLLPALMVLGQDHPVRWSFSAEEDPAGAPFVALRADCDEGWHYTPSPCPATTDPSRRW